jgi:hypothetical protein
VHVAAVRDGADLDARYEVDTGVTRRVTRGIAAGGRVVIGDADDRKARGARLMNELRRRQCAVGGGRVQVQIDQAEGRPRR